MQSIAEKYGITPGQGVCVFDPVTLMATSLAATAVGTGVTAAGTIAGGNAAQGQAQYQADQLRANEGTEIGASQRQMLDTQMKTRLANSQVRAGAAAGGVDTTSGSPLAIQKSNAARGGYQAAMDLFKGQNEATGTENQARGVLYSGQLAKMGSQYSAAGTIAGGASSMLNTYGAYKYPQLYGRTGMSYG